MNKKIKNATECELDGIKFKSKLEKRSYELFKEADLDAKYEIEKFILQEGFKPCMTFISKKGDLKKYSTKIKDITYTPDFIINHNGIKFLIEVKGFENDTFPLKRKLLLNLIKDNSNMIYIEVRSVKQIRQAIELIKNEEKE